MSKDELRGIKLGRLHTFRFGEILLYVMGFKLYESFRSILLILKECTTLHQVVGVCIFSSKTIHIPQGDIILLKIYNLHSTLLILCIWVGGATTLDKLQVTTYTWHCESWRERNDMKYCVPGSLVEPCGAPRISVQSTKLQLVHFKDWTVYPILAILGQSRLCKWTVFTLFF